MFFRSYQLSLLPLLLLVFSVSPRRTRFTFSRVYTPVQKCGNVSLEMTELNRQEKAKKFGSIFASKLRAAKIVPLKVRVRNESSDAVMLTKNNISLSFLNHTQIMEKLRGSDKWKRRSAAAMGAASGLTGLAYLGCSAVALGEVIAGTACCPCVLITVFIGGFFGIMAAGISTGSGIFWYKYRHAYDKYNAFLRTSWIDQKMVIQPGCQGEEIIFVNKADLVDACAHVQITTANKSTLSYELNLQRT